MSLFTTMAARVCRLCGTTASFQHAVSLFSPAAVKQQLSSRIRSLLNVEVAANDGLPQHICEKCKRRVETLERATEDLAKFRSQASEIYGSLVLARGGLKRTKESSASIGVSPDTLKVRPPSKKHLSQKQLDFTDGRFVDLTRTLATTKCV